MRYTKLQNTGFTLIELLLYIAIVGSLLLSISAFMAVSSGSQVRNQVENNINQEASFVMDYITQTIRNASSISAPSANNTAAQLTLVVPTGAKSPTVFELNNGVLQVREGAGAAVALTSSDTTISDLTFTNTSRSTTPGSIRISFTASHNTSSTRTELSYQQTFTSTASLRP